MTKLIEIKSNTNLKTLVIEYDLGNTCNYHCHYCFPGVHEGTIPWPKLENIKQNLDHLITYYKTTLGKENIILSLIGGEPTLWKELPDLVHYIKDKHKCVVTLISNGSRTIRWWNEYGDLFDRVVISYHHAEANINHVIQVCDLLYTKNVIVEVNVSMDPYNWNTCVEAAAKLKESKKRWAIVLQEIRINNEIIYNDDQKKFMKSKFFRLPNLFYFFKNTKLKIKKYWGVYDNGNVVRKSNHKFLLDNERYFFGWSCDLGIEELFIRNNGTLTGTCGNVLFNDSQYYNINDLDFVSKFNPKLTPTVCHSMICHCDREIAIQKRKIIKIRSE